MAVGVPVARADTQLSDFTGCYVQAHVGDPGSAGASNTTASVAARKAVTFAAAETNSTTRRRRNSAIIRWDGADVTGSASLTHWSVWTASTGGTLLFTGSFVSAITATAAVPVEIPVNGIEVNVGPIAS